MTFPYQIPVGIAGLKKGNYIIISQNADTGEKEEEFSLSIDPDKDGLGVKYYINPESKGSYAFVNINSLYEGGSVFDLANSDEFKVTKKVYNEKVFSYSKAGTVILSGTGLPESLMEINGIHYLFPINEDMKDDSEILEYCSKLLERE